MLTVVVRSRLLDGFTTQLIKKRRNPMERLLDITEVSDILKLTPDYLLNCCSKYPERIPKSFKVGSQRRFKESDVEEWIEQNYRQSVSR